MPRKLLTPQIKCPSGGDSCKFMTGLYTTENLEILGCLYAADSMSVSTFEVTQPALKKVTYSNVVHYGRSRSVKVIETAINRQPVCNFLLLTNNNLSHISNHF